MSYKALCKFLFWAYNFIILFFIDSLSDFKFSNLWEQSVTNPDAFYPLLLDLGLNDCEYK